MAGYTFKDFYIPERMVAALERYVHDGIEPGDFLAAVICNDLHEACNRADDENIWNLPAYAAWFRNEAPASCWGCREAMDRWIEMKRYAQDTAVTVASAL